MQRLHAHAVEMRQALHLEMAGDQPGRRRALAVLKEVRPFELPALSCLSTSATPRHTRIRYG